MPLGITKKLQLSIKIGDINKALLLYFFRFLKILFGFLCKAILFYVLYLIESHNFFFFFFVIFGIWLAFIMSFLTNLFKVDSPF